MHQVYAHPDERDQLVQRALRDGAFNHFETQVLTREGRLKWVSASVLLIRDEDGAPLHFTGSVLDIDERHEMQLALLRSESKYRTLVEHSQVGVFIMQGDQYTYANHAFAAMLGRERRGPGGRELQADHGARFAAGVRAARPRPRWPGCRWRRTSSRACCTGTAAGCTCG